MKGEVFLKRIILAIFITVIFIFTYQYTFQKDKELSQEQDSLKSEPGQASEEKESIYTSGALYSYIGSSQSEFIKQFGDPSRIDPSAYDYKWLIYNQDNHKYMQIGVENEKVVSVFILGDQLDIGPLMIGQPLAQVQEIVNMQSDIELEVNGNLYRFELTDDELNSIPLVQIGDVYAQLYFDTFTKSLSSVRFVDKLTLIKQRPYELVYTGELIQPSKTTKVDWNEVEKSKAKQIFEMTNIIRSRFDLPSVKWDNKTAEVAYNHSKEMFKSSYFSHTSPISGGLADRLKNGGVFYKLAGENIAAKYVDAISVVEGWLNSPGHRETLLNENFTHLGVGVYETYYTQNFIQTWNP